MATAQVIVTLALQKVGMLGLGAPPSSAQSAEGLEALNRLLRELFNLGAWRDVRINSAYDVPSDGLALRLHCMSGARSVTLPEMENTQIRDGLRVHVIDASRTAASSNITISRNGWSIDGAQTDLVISTAGGEALLMLDAASGTFRKAADLADLNTAVPLPSLWDEDLALMLASRWSGGRRFGQGLSDKEERRADDAWTKFRARYSKPPRFHFEAAVTNIGGACGSYTDLCDEELA